MEMGRKGASQLTTDQREVLLRPFTLEEVQSAVAGLNGEGAPGPNGLPVLFYKEFWALVKGGVMATLEELRSPQVNMERINKSYLFLLSKRQGAENVNEYRPISLSNSICLILAKVLANRLKEVIKELIGPFQYSFIPGRQLPDSVVMAGEILAAWKAQGTKGFMWKVDFTKAYDSLDWQFLWVVPGRVDQVDEAMCDIPFFLSAVEWAANRRVDLATKRDQTRVPISSNVVRPCSKCLI